jgi:hypothetical protein
VSPRPDRQPDDHADGEQAADDGHDGERPERRSGPEVDHDSPSAIRSSIRRKNSQRAPTSISVSSSRSNGASINYQVTRLIALYPFVFSAPIQPSVNRFIQISVFRRGIFAGNLL